MTNKPKLRHDFVEKPQFPTYTSIIGGYSSRIEDAYGYDITGGTNNTINNNTQIGGVTLWGRTGGSPNSNIEEYQESSVFTTELTHTQPREEVTHTMKREMAKNIFNRMWNDGMFDFWSYTDPTTFGERINCRVKVVKPTNYGQ